jgi:AraC-like DNA-binding protein
VSDDNLQKLGEARSAIDRGLDEDILFLKPGLTINDFSKEIGLPVYQVTRCITHFTGMSFIDFINQKRIEYCVKKLDSGEWKYYKVEAISNECGFNNRNSFTNAFKKFKGVSPSEYKSSLNP